MSAERFKNVTSLEIDGLLNNKTIILLNLAEYRLLNRFPLGLLYFTKWLFNRQRKVCCAQVYTQTDPPHYGNSQQHTYKALQYFFPLKNPSVTSDLQTFHSLIIPPSQMASPANVTDQLGPLSLYSAVNHSGAYFAKFKNSQKIEEKSQEYNFFTNVIRTKRTFLAANKKKIGVRGSLRRGFT